MSNLSQFSSTPTIGQQVSFDPYSVSQNPTINGLEYLTNGYIKSYSSTYANLVTAYKNYGWVGPSSTLNSTWNYPYALKMTCTTDGNFNLWTVANAVVYSGTSLTGTRTGGGGTSLSSISAYDGTAFGNVLVTTGFDGTNTYVYYSTNYGGTWTTGPTLTVSAQGMLAQNAATSIVAINTTPGTFNGAIYTSTNGTAWTTRIPSLNMGTVVRAVYSPAISAYVYVSSTGGIWTATDGFTLTSRTAPSGMVTSIGGAQYQGNYSASSATSTLISIGAYKFLKITSGPTFSIIDLTNLSTLLSANYTPAPFFITYDGTRFIISSTYQIFYSTDEGVNWTPNFRFYQSAALIQGSINYINSQLISFGNGSGASYPYIMTGKIAGSTPDYIGASISVLGGGSGNYLRIA